MAAINTTLPDDLQHQVEQLAHEQNRQPADLVTEAVRKYIDDQNERGQER